MAVQGVFASDQNIVGNRKGDFASMLLQIMPEGNAPLLALSSGMESADAHDTIINWFEEEHLSGRFDIASFVTDGDGTGIVVADASFAVPGTVLLNETTGEVVMVTASDVATNTLTVVRNIQGTGATTMTAAHFLQRIGTAHEEGSAKPTAIVNLGYARLNYTQIFRNSWAYTGTTRAVEYYTGSAPAKNRADAAAFHAEDIERAFLWGKKAIGVKNNKPFRMADGIYAMISTNITVASATTTYPNMDTFFQGIFGKNIKGKPNERIAFLGNFALGILNEIARLSSEMQITPAPTKFGMNVSQWITPYGTVMLKTHPLFTESGWFTKDLLILHPGAVRTRYLRRTHIDAYDSDGSRAGDDADFGVYTTEMSFEYRAEKTGGIFKQFVAAA